MVSGCGGVPFSRQRRQPPHVDRTVSGLTPWLGLDSSFGQQFGVQGVADAAVDLLNVTLTDVRDDVVGGIVASVLNHRWLDRVLMRVSHSSKASATYTSRSVLKPPR
jgi:hypothetical protein